MTFGHVHIFQEIIDRLMAEREISYRYNDLAEVAMGAYAKIQTGRKLVNTRNFGPVFL